MDDVSERIVLITGGSSGIGFEMARQMAERGSTVVICGRSREKLEDAKRKAPRLTTFICDLTCADDREQLHTFIAQRFPQLRVLVNNAGISRRFRIAKATNLEEQLTKEWQTNYLAPVLLAERFLPLLAQNRGTIVNVTSALAHVPLATKPDYCATKAALHSMTRSMRAQLKPLGVRVVEIAYPPVDTAFQDGRAPVMAITPEKAAAEAIRGLDSGREEIQVGLAGILGLFGRLFPGASMNRINGAYSAVPDEESLPATLPTPQERVAKE